MKTKKGEWIIIKPNNNNSTVTIIFNLEKIQEHAETCSKHNPDHTCEDLCPDYRAICCAFCPRLKTCKNVCPIVRELVLSIGGESE